MDKVKVFHINSFIDKDLAGNPAAVCPLDEWLPDETLQNIAARINLSETAFLVGDTLRWFTPEVEVDLCGHATLATAFVMFNCLDYQNDVIEFSTKSGILKVVNVEDLLIMDFPVQNFSVATLSDYNELGGKPVEVYKIEDHSLMVVFETEKEVRELKVDLNKLKGMQKTLVVTAPSENASFVSRTFAPHEGLDEDPVTGSSHTFLGLYWSKRLSRRQLHAVQVSERGGKLLLSIAADDRIKIAGYASLDKIYDLMIN